MFDELVESVAAGKTTNKSWGFLVSLTFQSVCLLTLILVPLIYTQALPRPLMDTFLVAPAAPAPRPAAPPTEVPAERAERAPRLISHGEITEPHAIPPHVEIFAEAPLPSDGDDKLGVAGGDPGPDLFRLFADDAKHESPAPVPPPAVEPAQTQRIPVGGVIEEAKLISRIRPVYPLLAVQARIQGNVILHAIIDKDGRVSELQVISGHPLLVQPAMQAVGQWRYQPTLLNGQPVEVETTIAVNFVLGG